MWWVPGMVLKVATTFSSACLATKPSHVDVEVDGLDWRLHPPMAYRRQTMTQSILTGAALSHHTMETGVARGHLTRV
jgi:hypothetical protein